MLVDVRSKFIKKYGKAYTEQFNELERLINHDETGDNRFLVVGIEAGLGKSLETDRINS